MEVATTLVVYIVALVIGDLIAVALGIVSPADMGR
ncbi:MAG: hypothetical protein GDYSWBUE_000002 [Candidatus Fervidibacterota bacterium]